MPDNESTNPSFTANSAIQSANAVKKGKNSAHPLLDPKSPVRLQVFYDSIPVNFEFKNGSAFLREPQEGQRVELKVTKDATNTRYGVVLKVNGQNTLRKQQLPDLSCGKWILSKPNEHFLIRGFQINDKELQQFRVLSQADSKSREVDFGEEVGLISITVFAEGEAQALDLDPDVQESKVVENAKLPNQALRFFRCIESQTAG